MSNIQQLKNNAERYCSINERIDKIIDDFFDTDYDLPDDEIKYALIKIQQDCLMKSTLIRQTVIERLEKAD